ncbi:MAG: peptidylprolyl isomerase [Thermomicrobiales bacterium]
MIRTSIALLFVALIALAGCGESDSDADEPAAAARNTATATATSAATAETTEAEFYGAPTKGFDDLQQWDTPPDLALENGVDYQAKIETNMGDIVVDLFEEETPQTVNNFVFLAAEGFYENVPFHRVLNGFVIQSGDPTGTGRGGPGYRFNDEPITREYTRGVLAMANAGPTTNGSQFFITLADLSRQLPKNYTIFGEVTEGMDVVDQIASVPVVANEAGEPSKPTEPVFIKNIVIVEE